jgi:hypothetical protein
MAGETEKVRFLSVERRESFGFKFFKDKEGEHEGVPVVDIIMKPTSIFIAQLVDPLRLTFERNEPRRLKVMQGRLPVRRAKTDPPKKRSDWRALDGYMVLTYEEAAPATPGEEPAMGAGADAFAAPTPTTGAANGRQAKEPAPPAPKGKTAPPKSQKK